MASFTFSSTFLKQMMMMMMSERFSVLRATRASMNSVVRCPMSMKIEAGCWSSYQQSVNQQTGVSAELTLANLIYI